MSDLIVSTPDEILIEYLINLDQKSLQSACRSFKRFSEICRDEYFWRRKTKKDFGSIGKDEGSTWKKTWIRCKDPQVFNFRFRYFLYEDIVRRDEVVFVNCREEIIINLEND